MALILLGLTKCVLCGEVITEGEVRGLPPVSDTQHALHKYFDAGFHAQCFDSWDKKEEALRVLAEDRQKHIESDYFKPMIAKHGRPKWLDETGEANY
jgi:hypothetical protein